MRKIYITSIVILFLLSGNSPLWAKQGKSLDRDYILFLVAETKIVSIKNFVDFLSLGNVGSNKNNDSLLELKKSELKQAVIEEMEIAGRYVFKKKKLHKKRKEWREISLNHIIMERELVIAPFKDIWEERLRKHDENREEKESSKFPFILGIPAAFFLGYFLAAFRFRKTQRLNMDSRAFCNKKAFSGGNFL